MLVTHIHLSMLETENLHYFCFQKLAQEPNKVNLFHLQGHAPQQDQTQITQVIHKI